MKYFPPPPLLPNPRIEKVNDLISKVSTLLKTGLRNLIYRYFLQILKKSTNLTIKIRKFLFGVRDTWNFIFLVFLCHSF